METANFNILLVDDEPDFLYPLVKRLSKRNLKVNFVGSGEEAIDLIRNKPIDVVVLDVKLPGMDGLETLRAIKAHDGLIEVIMLSGHACLDAAIEGMENGAFDYLMKPVDFDELYFKLQDAYKNRVIKQNKIKAMKERRGWSDSCPS